MLECMKDSRGRGGILLDRRPAVKSLNGNCVVLCDVDVAHIFRICCSDDCHTLGEPSNLCRTCVELVVELIVNCVELVHFYISKYLLKKIFYLI